MNDGGRIRYRRDTALEAVGIVAFVFAIALISPGALATFATARVLGLLLDIGQRWTFAVSSSVLAAAALCAILGWQGLARYLMLSAAVSFLVLVARFGLRAEWAIAFFEFYRP